MLAADVRGGAERRARARAPQVELDLRDGRAVRDAVLGHRPQVVINCAAWTAVDAAETCESEALEINGHAVRPLAQVCRRAGARLVHLSTDYVIRRRGGKQYHEDSPTGRSTPTAGPSSPGSARLWTRATTWCAPPGCTARAGRTSSAP